MRPFFAISWLLGLGLAVALVVIQGAGTIAETLASAGWGILWICLFRLAPLGCAAIAWGLLIERPSRPPATFVFIARWIGESINNLLPVAQVGGDVIRVRLLTHQGVQASVAAASVIGDVTAGLLSELVLAAAGFVLLLERRGVESWGGVLACLVVLGCLVVCLIAAQVSGIVKPILRRFGGLLRSA
jgi:hypothetical protein